MNYLCSKNNSGLEHLNKWLSIDLKCRKEKSEKIREQYPGYCSVILSPIRNSDPELKKYKYILPLDTPIWKFNHKIYSLKSSTESKNSTIVMFINNKIPNSASDFSNMTRYLNEDGFIYIKYGIENTFG